MPSESLPWDHKEGFLKDRKQERGVGSDVIGGVSGSGGVGVLDAGACSTSRWREPYHGVRDCPRASPRRPSTGFYKDDLGYQQLYPEESSEHGCTSSRSGDRFCPEEEIFMPSLGRSGGGRSGISCGRESRGSYRQSPCLDSSGDSARQRHFSPVTAQRSVVVPITSISSSSSQIPQKDLDKSDGGVFDGSGTGQRCDRDYSLGSITWKPLKWNRPSSFSFSKGVRPESEETNLEISAPQVKESPLSSPVISNLPPDDRATSKKPRLGWGQGLAKYEKQKVEGTSEVSGHTGSFQSPASCKDFLHEASPKFSAPHGSMSPATPSSATCSSSPACTDEKFSIKVSNAKTDGTQCSELSPSALRLHHSAENISINFDRLDTNSIRALDLLLTDLMQLEETCSGDSPFTRHSSLNKLLLLKKDISKELEKTECEIDLFENKLKSFSCDMLLNNHQEHACTAQGVDFAQANVNPADLTKSEKCMPASSVGLEGQQVVHSHLSEEHTIEAKDINHNSEKMNANSISCDVQLDCSEREAIYSSSLQTDVSPVNNNSIYKNAVDSSVSLIMASNKDAAKRASQEFDLAMPTSISQFNFWESDNILRCRRNYIHIKGKLAMKKRKLKFKERFLTLKFRALHRLWMEDLNLLTMRKNRTKSSKRFEVNSRLPQLVLQKHRSSTRSRHALPACNLTVVPTTEIINFTSKLLSDSQLKPYRNNLKMPAQIIDESDRRYSRFISNNGLIENPSALEKEKMMMNPWMQEEKNIFLEMLATFGKDFKKISSFIPHKTTADCVEYYYKNHKSESFTEVKRQLKLQKQWQSRNNNTYLITSGPRFNREANATSLELLGSASIIAAESNKRNCQKQSGRVSRRINGLLEKANSEISGSEKEAAAADVLAGICGALSSDAMSSCVTSSIDPPEKRFFARIDRSLTPEAAPQTIDEEDACSDESSDEMESADWTDEEKSMFISAFNIYGKDFVKVAHFVRTRSRDQCRIFFSKARKCLGLDMMQPGSTNGVTPTSDVNEGRSGTDDACSTQSCSKVDADFTQSMLKTCSEGNASTDIVAHQIDADRPCARCEVDKSIQEEHDKFDDKSSLLNEDKLLIKGGDVDVKLNDEDKLESLITVQVAQKASEAEFIDFCNVVEHKNDECPNHVQIPSTLPCPTPKEPHCELAKPEAAVSSESNCMLPGLSSISFNKTDDMKPSIAIVSLQDGGKCKQESVSEGLHAQDLLKSTFPPNLIDSPLHIPAMMNGGRCFSSCSLPEMSDGNCVSAGILNSSQEFNEEKYKKEAKSGDCRKTHSQGNNPNAKSECPSHRAGDLMLFGQILSHPSQPKSCSAEDFVNANAVTDSSSTNWKDSAVFAPLHGSNNTPSNHRDEPPQRSYGFWDGNRIQTGFSSLPESTITLAKYQVSNSSPFHTNINSEYQQQTQMQAVCTEKKFIDTFPVSAELQKRNGFEVLSGFQQQRRMMHFGVNMAGPGVSDPVAALQMHYSGRRAKILAGDLESLAGDMGGR